MGSRRSENGLFGASGVQSDWTRGQRRKISEMYNCGLLLNDGTAAVARGAGVAGAADAADDVLLAFAPPAPGPVALDELDAVLL